MKMRQIRRVGVSAPSSRQHELGRLAPCRSCPPTLGRSHAAPYRVSALRLAGTGPGPASFGPAFGDRFAGGQPPPAAPSDKGDSAPWSNFGAKALAHIPTCRDASNRDPVRARLRRLPARCAGGTSACPGALPPTARLAQSLSLRNVRIVCGTPHQIASGLGCAPTLRRALLSPVGR